MLQAIRDKLTGWITWFVVGLIVIPFAFWGIQSFKTNDGDPVLVKVGAGCGFLKLGNCEEIHQSQFQHNFEQQYARMQAMLGERFKPEMFDQGRFREAVLNNMEEESMMRQYTQQAGYRATDAALFSYLSNVPVFQDKGKFSTETYKAALARQGMSPERFETQMRNSLVLDQMREGVQETAFVTDAEAKQAYMLANQQRWLSYALFDSAKYAAQISVSDEQVKARYETDKAKYMAPERIKLAYVELSLDDMPKADSPGPDALKIVYDAEKDARFSSPEERRARHILVNFGADKSVSKKKIEDIAAKIKGGASFDQMARENSDDPGSKASGGDLSWVRRGQMTEKFEKSLFDLKPGEVSDVVETEFGWHLIKLEQLHPAAVQPFEDAEVQKQLVTVYQTREAQRHFQEKSEKLEQLAFENPTSLEVAAKDLGLTIQTTDWFTRAGGTGIAATPAVKAAAFSAEVVKDGDNSKPLPISETKVAVIRKAEYEAPRQKTLEEVKDQVHADAAAAAAKDKAIADAAEVLKAAKAGTSLADALKGKGAELVSAGLIKRDATSADRAIVTALFKLPRPAAGASQFSDVTLANGNVAVIGLSAVQDATYDKESTDALTARHQLREVQAGNEFAGFRKGMENVIKVKVVNAPKAAEAATPAE